MLITLIEHYLGPIAFFQSIFMAIFLFTHKKGSRKQNTYLALLLLSFGILIGSRFMLSYPGIVKYLTLLYIGFDFRFLIAPLFYLYLKSIFKPSHRFKIIELLHAGIFLSVLIIQTINKNIMIQPWQFFLLIDVIQLTIYILWSFYEFRLIDLFVNPDYFKLDRQFIYWLRFFIIANILTYVIMVIAYLLLHQIIIIPQWEYMIARLLGISNFLFINTIVYLALKIPDFFISIKYKNSELPVTIQQRYKTKLQNHMELNKPYLNPSLSLHNLADETSISPKHLSQIINSSFEQNFYQYINSYRIEVCKELLSDKAQNCINILEIAYEAGFNSKNSFNAAFKKHTGMTPSEFRKRQLNLQ